MPKPAALLRAGHRSQNSPKARERALEEAELKFRTIADFTFDWEFMTDAHGSFLYVSPSCERICGYAPSEFLASPLLFLSIVHPEDRDIVAAKIARAYSFIPEEGFDFRIIRKDGTLRWVAMVIQTATDPQRHILGMRGSIRDVSERRRIQDVLKDNEERLKRLSEATFEGIAISEGGRILDAKPPARCHARVRSARDHRPECARPRRA